jgi:hypothetical protein
MKVCSRYSGSGTRIGSGSTGYGPMKTASWMSALLMVRASLVVLGVLLVSVSALADTARRRQDARERHKTAQALCRSASVLPLDHKVEADKTCSPAALYDTDPVAARRCALAGGGDDRQSENEAVLAMTDANGFGTPRDINAAIAHACRLAGTSDETDSRINTLGELKAGPGESPFEICNGDTSGDTLTFCKKRQEASRAMLASRLATLRKDPSRVKAFEDLSLAQNAYVEARMDELDLVGEGRDSFSEKNFVRKEWTQNIFIAIVAGMLPAPPVGEPEKARHELDTNYAAVIDARNADADRVMRIKATQKMWLLYRTAFVAAVEGTSPGAAEFIRTTLTYDRAFQLKALVP